MLGHELKQKRVPSGCAQVAEHPICIQKIVQWEHYVVQVKRMNEFFIELS